MRHLIPALALLFAGTGATAAYAGPDHSFDVGVVTPAAYAQAVTHLRGAGAPPVSFWDVFNFTVGSFPVTSATAVDVRIDLGGGAPALYSVSNLDVDLWTTGGSWITGATGSPASFTASLAPGDYRVSVRGDADGTLGGIYAFAIAAVPEPGQWAMMLAGLGVLAVAGCARRRHRRQAGAVKATRPRIVALLGAVLLLGGGAARAAGSSFEAGVLGASPYVNTVTHVRAPGTAPSSFVDVFTFTVSDYPVVSATAVEVPVSIPGVGALYGISGLGLELFSASGTSLGVAGAAAPSLAQLLIPGSYRLAVSGTASGLLGGIYAVALTGTGWSVSPVPEPGQWALMLAGLAVVAGALRLRAR